MGVLSDFGFGYFPRSSKFDPSKHLSYTGSKTIIDDGDGNYRVKFTSSGTLTSKKDVTIDACIVGGGGGGGSQYGGLEHSRGGGGGGGHVTNVFAINLSANVGYPIVIGDGGEAAAASGGDGTNGEASSAFGSTADGGQRGFENGNGGDGGSGGGAVQKYGGGDGDDGGDTINSNFDIYRLGGDGDGVTTKEFGEADGDQYGDGAPGYAPSGTPPTGLHGVNSGYGGKGGYTTGYEAEDGKSGIVVIRNHRVNLTNLITNGDFNDLTGWSASFATLSVSSNLLSITSDGTSVTMTRAAHDLSLNPSSGHMLFYSGWIQAANDEATGLIIYLRDGLSGTLYGRDYDGSGAQRHPDENEWYYLTAIVTVGTLSNNLRFVAESYFPSSGDPTGNVTKVKKAFCVDLTEAFGAGNEPTLLQMQRIMTKYTNCWFDGTKSVNVP